MKSFKKSAFTLVELLVVITILAIISVVAYQNFGGAVDKANAGRKIGDVATIESSLQQYKAENNFYPKVGEFDENTNYWGYDTRPVSGNTEQAPMSNIIQVSYSGNEVDSLNNNSQHGGGKVIDSETPPAQIGAKGTIGKTQLGKYLSKDLYDPEIGDLKVGTDKKMIDYGVGRYVYGIYRKSYNWGELVDSNSKYSNLEGIYYNIAFTIKKEGSETYTTKIVGDYDNNNFDTPSNYPVTLIGGLTDGQDQTGSSSTDSYGIPYAVTDFAQ